MKGFSKKLTDWLFVGARLPILIIAFIVVAAAVTVTVVSIVNRPESTTVTAFVTVRGLDDESKNFTKRQISIEDGDAVSDIFSLKYEDIYNAFGKPYVEYNEFATLLGVRKTSEKSFHVTIDGVQESNLSQAYVYGGQTVTISYY